jgi:hypothetical protein
MQEWNRLKEEEAEFDLAFALVADAELFRLESVVRWLEVAEERLRRAEADGWSDAPPAPVPTTVLQRRRRIAARR